MLRIGKMLIKPRNSDETKRKERMVANSNTSLI